MKCQNCGTDNVQGALQCTLCQLPLFSDDTASRVGAASKARGNTVALFLAACGVTLFGVIGYSLLTPAGSSGGAPPESPTVLPVDIEQTPRSEPVPVEPVAAVPASALPTPVEVVEGGSAADRHPGDAAETDVAVQGRLPREAISAVMRRNMKDVRACYEQGLKRKPTLAGVVKVTFIIGRDGKVMSASVSESTLTDAAVTACIVKVVYEARFPKPESGIVRVVFPFQFKAQ